MCIKGSLLFASRPSNFITYRLINVEWNEITSLHITLFFQLVVPMTFGHSWLRHSSHPEHAVVPTDVVRVSKPAVCTLRLSIRVFTSLPDVKKPKTPVLTFWTLVPESFENFQKHAPLYNRRFFR